MSAVPNPATYIAVDLGGTSVRAAHFGGGGKLLARAKRATNADRDAEFILGRIAETISEVLPDDGSPCLGIGIGSPGPLDPYEGVIIRTPNLPTLKYFPLASRVASLFDLPVALNNDANVAALGEWQFGAARGHDHIIYLTISTGVGSGVIMDGYLLQGAQGLGSEMGHTIVDPDGPMCPCGQQGHLEAYASGTSIARDARAKLRAGVSSTITDSTSGSIDMVTAEHVGQAAMAGDALARALIENAGRYIGIALASFLHTFNPTVVVMGGGVSNVGDLLFNPIRNELRERAISEEYWRNLKIVRAALADDAGLYGALALAKQQFPAAGE